jgi:L-ascorbate metabolism protein UlaG (beta-lactamase superfamily)
MASVRLIRHATLHLDYGGKRFLVDPMLAAKGTLDPAAQSGNPQRNPLVDLPMPLEQVLEYDECLLTHSHRDHLDGVALDKLPRDRPIWCQPEDKARLDAAGFKQVLTLAADAVERDGISICRTAAEHGKLEMIKKMGASSGFVLKHMAEPTLYLTGDTVWCPAVQAALRTYRPEAIIVNAGAAEFVQGGPVTMNKEDVVAIAREASLAQIVVVHLEAWNHCPLSRAELEAELEERGMTGRVHVPGDGDSVSLG